MNIFQRVTITGLVFIAGTVLYAFLVQLVVSGIHNHDLKIVMSFFLGLVGAVPVLLLTYFAWEKTE